MFFVLHVWMWELDHKESWVPKNWCLWTKVLEKNLESPLDFKEIKPVNFKENQSWIFIGRTDAEAEAPILWPNWLIGKDSDAAEDWGQEEKGTTEDEMVGWHHRHDSHEFEQALGVVMNREAWHAAVYGVTKSWTRLSDWTELNSLSFSHFLLFLKKENFRSFSQIEKNFWWRHYTGIFWLQETFENQYNQYWCWSWSSNTLATWCEEPTHWKRSWCWERLRARGEGATGDEMVGWHHWLNGYEFEKAQWRTGKPGMLQFMGLKRVRHNLATEQQQ